MSKIGQLESKKKLTLKKRNFSITKINVPKVTLIQPINTTLYSSLVELRWRVEYEGEIDISDIWYDIYLDNSTNIAGIMNKITEDEHYGHTFYNEYLTFEENLTYYWYVIPHLELESSSITGVCSSGVVWFKFGSEDVVFNLSLELDQSEVTIKPDSSEIVYFNVKNIGNTQTTVDIYVTFEQF